MVELQVLGIAAGFGLGFMVAELYRSTELEMYEKYKNFINICEKETKNKPDVKIKLSFMREENINE